MIVSKGYDGKVFRLVNEQTGEDVKQGDYLSTSRGETVILKGYTAPHKPSSQGFVYAAPADSPRSEYQYYASVCGLKWVDVNDPVPARLLDSSAKVEVRGIALAETEALARAMQRASAFMRTGAEILITCSRRSPEGWLEYGIRAIWESESSTGNLFVAMIQRTEVSDFEFHS